MENKNITALVSTFARCYHYKNNKYRIFSDNCAEKILSNKFDIKKCGTSYKYLQYYKSYVKLIIVN